jgi:hypothetical protein
VSQDHDKEDGVLTASRLSAFLFEEIWGHSEFADSPDEIAISQDRTTTCSSRYVPFARSR